MKIWNGTSSLNSVKFTIPSEELIGTLHIILLDSTRNLVLNPSPTHLHHPRIPLSNLITGLIGTENLLLPLGDSLSLRNKNEMTSLRKEHASGVGNQVMF